MCHVNLSYMLRTQKCTSLFPGDPLHNQQRISVKVLDAQCSRPMERVRDISLSFSTFFCDCVNPFSQLISKVMIVLMKYVNGYGQVQVKLYSF